ncbi:MAG: DUF2156 domain-containing protein [Deltaproteobacteria bacterium]|nr:DUF2156 domain-containing protein [Deltaproteobacteria bacterium]
MRFETLEPHDYDILKPFFVAQPYELCVFSPALVFAWRNEEGFSVSFAIEEDTLFMAAHNPDRPDDNYLALPLPIDRFEPDDLVELARKLDMAHFSFVPGAYLEQHGFGRLESLFQVTEQNKFRDYIYRTRDLVALVGNRYAKKRNLIHQFERDFLSTGRARVEPIVTQVLPECLDFITRWYSEKNSTGFTSDDEHAACYTIDDFDRLELTGILVRVDSRICGLGTCARLSDDMGVLNLEMAFARYKGLYQFLDRECARQLFQGRFEYINKESDMGLPGLRQSKRSYHPIRRASCYRLTVKNPV